MQIRIDREKRDFELVKLQLDNLENMALENFLQSYLDCIREKRKEIIDEEYFQED